MNWDQMQSLEEQEEEEEEDEEDREMNLARMMDYN